MVRLLNGKTVSDQISTKVLLKNKNMLSVNQINAQIKITEVWKAMHDSSHPMKIKKVAHGHEPCTTRAVSNGELMEIGKSEIVQSTYLSDASKAWNKCHITVKASTNLWAAKKAIRLFVETLPI